MLHFKRINWVILILLLLFSHVTIGMAYSLQDVYSLGLPVITIETENGEEPTCDYVDHPEGAAGYSITNATKVAGRLTISQGDSLLYDSGPYAKDKSGMRIKIRGNTSAFPAKKPYKIKLETKADLLLRGLDETYADKDWLLIKDPDFHQHIGYETCRLVGIEWASRCQYVNVVINGDYRGLYLLCEPVERNVNSRINVKKSGFIVESDAYWWNEDLYIPSALQPFGWTLKYPEADEVSDNQLSYITRQLTQLEDALARQEYAPYIDVESWARWLLAHDILGTWDSYGSNLYLAKRDDQNSRFTMPTLWDFDTIFKMKDAWANVHNERFFFQHLLASRDRSFARAYVNLWMSLRSTVTDGMTSYIDAYAASSEAIAVDASLRLDAERWHEEYQSLKNHLSTARSWFVTRAPWIDERINEELNEPYRVLNIGNSYSDDVLDLLHLLVEHSDINPDRLSICSLTRGSGSFSSWVDCWQGADTQPYHFRRRLGRPVVTRNADANPGDATLMHSALQAQDWDLIILHQRSEYAPYYDRWSGNGEDGRLEELIRIIRDAQPNAKLGFQLVHSYADYYEGNSQHSSLVRWQAIASSARRLMEDNRFSVIIPYGTAIESLRESMLNTGHDFSRDGTHLGYGLAQYTAACTYFEAVIAPMFYVSVSGNTARYACSESELAQAKFPEACIDVTDENAHISQQIAVDAVANPYVLTSVNIECVFEDCSIEKYPTYNALGCIVTDDYHGIRFRKGKKAIIVK